MVALTTVRKGSMPVVTSRAAMTASELKGTKVPARNEAMPIPIYPYSIKN